jgi:CheY-like chemotaxis protein
MMPPAIEARQQETRILVVDASDLMRHSLRTLLERQDHWKVSDEASNGEEAIAKVRRKTVTEVPENPALQNAIVRFILDVRNILKTR